MMNRQALKLAVLILALALVISACSGGSQQDLDRAQSSVDAINKELDAADAEVGKLENLDMTSEDASATVAGVATAALARTAAAEKELAALKSAIGSAKDGELKSKWQSIAAELEQLLSAHSELQTEFLAYGRQMALVGLVEKELPLTEEDLAQAFEIAAASDQIANATEAMRLATKTARGNFQLTKELTVDANELAPAAKLDAIARFCEEEIKVCDLMDKAAAAIDRKDIPGANRLLKSAYDLHLKNQELPEPAIFDDGYETRFDALHAHEDEHIARATTLLKTVQQQ